MDEKYLSRSLEETKGFVNRSIIAILSLHLLSILNYLNKEYFGDDTAMSFLDMPVYSEYLSAIYGILSFVFVLVIYLRIRQLGSLFRAMKSKPDQGKDWLNLVKHFYWIASPFHEMKTGLWVFRFIAGFMGFQLLWSGLAHLLHSPSALNIPLELYRNIGVMDAVLFVIAAPLIFLLFREVASIRKDLGL